jgi:hypothetical protein
VLAKGSGQKFIARGYQTTEADPCTTGSKKAQTESVQGKLAGAISMRTHQRNQLRLGGVSVAIGMRGGAAQPGDAGKRTAFRSVFLRFFL